MLSRCLAAAPAAAAAAPTAAAAASAAVQTVSLSRLEVMTVRTGIRVLTRKTVTRLLPRGLGKDFFSSKSMLNRYKVYHN